MIFYESVFVLCRVRVKMAHNNVPTVNEFICACNIGHNTSDQIRATMHTHLLSVTCTMTPVSNWGCESNRIKPVSWLSCSGVTGNQIYVFTFNSRWVRQKKSEERFIKPYHHPALIIPGPSSQLLTQANNCAYIWLVHLSKEIRDTLWCHQFVLPFIVWLSFPTIISVTLSISKECK